jgi:hypothetical protein
MTDAPAQPGRRLLRDVAVVAWQELADALRSRRALVVLLLFFLGSVAGTLLSIKFIHTVEKSLSGVLGLEAGTGTGGTTATLWKSQWFRSTVTNMVDDKSLAEALLNVPPLSLFFSVIAFLFTPMLVMLTAAPRLAEEIWSGRPASRSSAPPAWPGAWASSADRPCCCWRPCWPACRPPGCAGCCA